MLALQVSSDGSTLASGGADSSVKLWKRESFSGHSSWKVGVGSQAVPGPAVCVSVSVTVTVVVAVSL